MSWYALIRLNVLEIIGTWKFPRSLPHCAQYAFTKGILRQTGSHNESET